MTKPQIVHLDAGHICLIAKTLIDTILIEIIAVFHIKLHLKTMLAVLHFRAIKTIGHIFASRQMISGNIFTHDVMEMLVGMLGLKFLKQHLRFFNHRI